ncbi:unnamed protein product, partial [Nesidiocoris tenuis]
MNKNDFVVSTRFDAANCLLSGCPFRLTIERLSDLLGIPEVASCSIFLDKLAKSMVEPHTGHRDGREEN